MTSLADALPLRHGPALPNRLALAPLTNTQSHLDGTLSDDEIGWLTARARGGFGLVVTAAAYVQRSGLAWAGQLGVSDDAHLPGLTRLADCLRANGAVSVVQLHHGGLRANAEASGEQPVAPFADERSGARALTTGEVEQLVADFASAAARCERAGFDGVQVHGAHGYVLGQFLDVARNTRTDRYGGDAAGRARIMHEVVDAIRTATGPHFQVGLRLSPERWGIDRAEAVALAGDLLTGRELDHLDLSMWQVGKTPEDDPTRDRPLVDDYLDLPRHGTALALTGGVRNAADAQSVLDRGADIVCVGRAAVADHAFAARTLDDPAHPGPTFPVTPDQLRAECVGEAFVDYFTAGWPDLVATPA